MLSLRNSPLFASSIVLAHALSAPALLAQGTIEAAGDLVADIKAQIARLDEEIAAARSFEGAYSGGALSTISALNTQTLELTQSVLEARLAAEEGGVPIKVTVPAVEPDLELADELSAEIKEQQDLVEAAWSEAQGAGGLMAALAMTRYETERLSLAQIRQAWLRARYGISFPAVSAVANHPSSGADLGTTVASATADGASEGAEQARSLNAGIAWADPDHPSIDYSATIFSQLNNEGYNISGWWGIELSKAALDDSPQAFAINVSDWGTQWTVNHPSMKAGCIEGEVQVIFDADDFLMTDFQTYTIPVTLRIDDAEARQMTWSGLTSNDGAGLFGAPAEDLLRDLQDAEGVFLRLRETNGETHDLEIKLAGAEKAFTAVAEACQFSLLDLTMDDYRAVQILLNAGGFNAGTPDGVWGSGSRVAISDYQKANGLAVTGVPDEATLAAMGMNSSE